MSAMQSPELPYRISSLLIKELEETISASEKQELDDWVNLSERNRALFDQLTNPAYLQNELQSLQNFDKEKAKEDVLARIGQPQSRGLLSIIRWQRYLAAAVIIAIIGVSLFLFGDLQKDQKGGVDAATNSALVKHDSLIVPGTDKAVLTLSNGRTIVLDSARGAIQNELDLRVDNKTGNLVYAPDNPVSQSLAPQHLLTTPRGGQYQLTLSDGTKVWLNAASSIRFPAFFTGLQRRVEITGEAYFEVAHEPLHPFIVSARGMDVEVLGTHFNINAYEEEPFMSTTLLEGSVSIHHPGGNSLLKPGQQAQISSSGKMRVESDIDTEEVVAWKNGLFNFNRADIAAIMRQISRWYNVEVAFEGKTPTREFVGKVSRQASLQELLQLLEMSNIHFRLEGKKIVVTP